MLLSKPSIGPEILHDLDQVKELNISKHAWTLMTIFGQFFVPMLQNIDNMRENEQLVETKETSLKESWDVVIKSNKEITR